MRVKISFFPENGELLIPANYNHIVQAMIYNNISESLAKKLHDKGFSFEKRTFKLFTFSRLFGKHRFSNGKLTFVGMVHLDVASPDTDILESLAMHLVRKRTVKLYDTVCEIHSIEVLMEKNGIKMPVLVKALSPITIYSTLKKEDGKKKTYYYSPFEKEFSELILKGLYKKVVAFRESKNYPLDLPELNGSYIKPVKVSSKHLKIINYKGFIIKGWLGLYELSMPSEYFLMGYDAGFGSKCSQGFGMVEILDSKLNKEESRNEK